MKVLIVVENSPKQRFLVKLHTEGLVTDVKALISKNKREKAIITALSNGRLEKEARDNEALGVDADLVLSKDGAHWDLC